MDIKVFYTGVIISHLTGFVLLLENPNDPGGLCRAQCQVYCQDNQDANQDETGRSCVDECDASRGQAWKEDFCRDGMCGGSCIHWQGDYTKKIPEIPRLRLGRVEENKVELKWQKDWTINNTVIYVVQGQTSAQKWILWGWAENEYDNIEIERHLCGYFQFRVAAISPYGTFGFSEPRSVIPMPEVSLSPSKFLYNASSKEFSAKAICKPPEGFNTIDLSCEWDQTIGICPDFETAQPIAQLSNSSSVMLLKYNEVGYRCQVMVKVRLKLECGSHSEVKHVVFKVADCRPRDAFKCPNKDFPPGRVSHVEVHMDKIHSTLRVRWNEPADKGSHGIDRFVIEWGECVTSPGFPIRQLDHTDTTTVTQAQLSKSFFQPEINITIKNPSIWYGVRILALGPGQALSPDTFQTMQGYCTPEPGPAIGRPPDPGHGHNEGHNLGKLILDDKGIKVVHYAHSRQLQVSWGPSLYRDKKPDAIKQYALRWGPLTNQETKPELQVENFTLIPGNNTEINITVNHLHGGANYGIQLRYLHSPVSDEDDVKWNMTEVIGFTIPGPEDSNNSAPPVPDNTVILPGDNTTDASSQPVTDDIFMDSTTNITPTGDHVKNLPNALTSDISQRNKLIYILVPCCSVVLLVVVAVTLVMHRKRKSSRLETPLSRGRSEGWDRYNSIHLPNSPNSQGESERVVLVPDKWELPRSSIVPGPILGTGAFGQVVKGCVSKSALLHVLEQSHTEPLCLNLKAADHTPHLITAAIKMLQEDIEEVYRQDFMKEIKLMKGIGFHRHIVSMLGCCTVGNPVCLVVEHVPNGDLLSYLRDIRLTCKHGSTQPETDQDNNYTNMAPITVTPSDLVSFARQIAIGMEFLSQKGYVHRDLAARNILVGDHKSVKIGDFGLARYVYDDKVYVNRRGGKLPVKWMSIEAIFDLTFSSASDVWSFGIVLFEICTLGGTPYPTLDNTDLLRELRRGWRMDAPDGCSQDLYQVMLNCWKEVPTSRPTFSDLRKILERMLERTSNVNYMTFPVINESPDDSLVASSSDVFGDALDENEERVSENSVSPSTKANSEDGSMTLPIPVHSDENDSGDNFANGRSYNHSRQVCFDTESSLIFRKEADDDVFDSASLTDVCECGKESNNTAFQFDESCSSCGQFRKSLRDQMESILPVCLGALEGDRSSNDGSPLSDGFILRLDGCRSDRIESDLSSSTCSSGEFLIPSNVESHLKERTHSGGSDISVTSTSYLLVSDHGKTIEKTDHLPMWEETRL